MSRYDQDLMLSNFRVGIITFAAVVLVILAITFAGGDKGLLFQKQMVVKARLANVGGLKKGSSVTVGGMNIGRVSNIAFVGGAEEGQIEVAMQVRRDMRERIKTDSIPSIRTQGMLGDRYIDISSGTKNADVLPEGKPIFGKAATDFDETLHQALSVLN